MSETADTMADPEPGLLSLVSAAFQPASLVPHPDGAAIGNEAASNSALAVGDVPRAEAARAALSGAL